MALRPIHGNNVQEALASQEAAQIRLNDRLREGQQLAADFASSFTQDLARGTNTMDALYNSLQRVASQLIDMAVRQLVMRAFGALLGGGGGIGVGGGIAVGSANGNVFNRGQIIPFAAGGVIDRPILFPMAHGMGLMGESGPEAVMPLKRMPSGNLGVESAGGGATTVAPVINLSIDARGAQKGAGDEIW